MRSRFQRTIRRPAKMSGVGFFTGGEISLCLLPAEADHGIVFRRIDRPDAPPIPATIERVIEKDRRTAVGVGGVSVELTEHLLAAFAGLQVDNALIEVDGPEVPGGDGSALPFVDLLMAAEPFELPTPREQITIERPVCVTDGGREITGYAHSRPSLNLSYDLDYGPDSPVPCERFSLEVTPESFVRELAGARTFIAESEVKALRARGYGKNVSAKDLLVFSDRGLIENEFRYAAECARHKILDCIGDLALGACDLVGQIDARRSGHALNRRFLRTLLSSQSDRGERAVRRAA